MIKKKKGQIGKRSRKNVERNREKEKARARNVGGDRMGRWKVGRGKENNLAAPRG